MQLFNAASEFTMLGKYLHNIYIDNLNVWLDESPILQQLLSSTNNIQNDGDDWRFPESELPYLVEKVMEYSEKFQLNEDQTKYLFSTKR